MDDDKKDAARQLNVERNRHRQRERDRERDRGQGKRQNAEHCRIIGNESFASFVGIRLALISAASLGFSGLNQIRPPGERNDQPTNQPNNQTTNWPRAQPDMCARHASVTEHAVKIGNEEDEGRGTGEIFTATPLTPAVVLNALNPL